MRIKEAEQRTGLTAKAIRLYESKGLLKPARETENDYRDYTEEDVARLKTIAILRKLDVPVKTIKEWTDGETELRDILQKAADQNREASRENELRHRLAEDLNDILEDNPGADLGEAAGVMEPINELLLELDDILREDEEHVGTPLYTTLIALGPILGTMFGIGAPALSSGDAVYYLRQFLPEWILFVVCALPITKWLGSRFASREDKFACILRDLVPAMFALTVFGIGYLRLSVGSFNPFIYFRF
jgi:DNA-binding transcriptional MerR regulator